MRTGCCSGWPMVGVGSLLVFSIFPGCAGPDLVDEESDSLIVGWVKPEHPVKDGTSIVESGHPPEAQPVAVHAAQKWSVVDMPPQQHAVKIVAKR